MLIISAKKHLNRIKICDKIIKRVEKVNTLLDGNAVRKNRRFLTALYPRQYHPSALEKPLIQRFFAYKVFFRRACQRKNVNAA